MTRSNQNELYIVDMRNEMANKQYILSIPVPNFLIPIPISRYQTMKT